MLADRRSRFCEAAPKFTPVSGLAGGNRRGNRASREVFPLDGGPPRDSPRRRAAHCAARVMTPLPVRSPTAIPWRERPPEMAAWPAKPAARTVVAHATLNRLSVSVSAPKVHPVVREDSTRNLENNSMNFSAVF